MVLAKHKLKKESDKAVSTVTRKTSSKITNNNVKFSRDIDLFEQKSVKNKSIKDTIKEKNRKRSILYDKSSIKYNINPNNSFNSISNELEDNYMRKYKPNSVVFYSSNKLDKYNIKDNFKENDKENNTISSLSNNSNNEIKKDINYNNKSIENFSFNLSSNISSEENSNSVNSIYDFQVKNKSYSANFIYRNKINLENNIEKKSKFLTNIISNDNDVIKRFKSNEKTSKKSIDKEDKDNKDNNNNNDDKKIKEKKLKQIKI
jgi:hypothetical protein